MALARAAKEAADRRRVDDAQVAPPMGARIVLEIPGGKIAFRIRRVDGLGGAQHPVPDQDLAGDAVADGRGTHRVPRLGLQRERRRGRQRRSAAVLAENVECEIMQPVLEEARESYDEQLVVELRSDTVAEMDANVERVGAWLQQWKADNA